RRTDHLGFPAVIPCVFHQLPQKSTNVSALEKTDRPGRPVPPAIWLHDTSDHIDVARWAAWAGLAADAPARSPPSTKAVIAAIVILRKINYPPKWSHHAKSGPSRPNAKG